MKRILLFLIFLFLAQLSAYALVPLESVILGDFTNEYNQKIADLDPINYIFSDGIKGKIGERTKISRYRGLINEGQNLKNMCETSAKVSYSTYLQEETAKQSTIASLQYIGIDLTTRALASYAKFFEFEPHEYKNMIENLTGNYCSNNLSIISIKQLKNNMLALFNAESVGLALPSIQDNSIFPRSILKLNLIDSSREQEFAVTARLFRAFCSWGGSTNNLGLLVPLLKDPTIMSFVGRSMAGVRLGWDKFDNKIYKVYKKESASVYCENLICRRQGLDDFKIKFPRSMGYKSIVDDVERGYCTYFKDSNYATSSQVPLLKKVITKQTLDDENLLISQFIALVTGIPDLFLQLDTWKDSEKLLRSSVDESWNKWADDRNNSFSKELFFEEQLTLEKVDRKHYFHYLTPKFSVQLDVNMGETDRINQQIGKIDATFNLYVNKNLLSNLRKDWSVASFKTKEERERMISLLEQQIKKDVEKINKLFSTSLWKGNMERLLTKEILEQLVLYEGKFFKYASTEKVKIPITFNFAPFALKYMNYKFRLLEKTKSAKEVEETFKTKFFIEST